MDFDHPPLDPVCTFQDWFVTARERCGLPNPNAMTLATIDPDGRPSARIVLLKGFDQRGVVFYTNHRSRKGRALEANPRVALVFHWDPLERQVRFEGPVERIDDAESDAYFASRPRASRISAWASEQSQPVDDRRTLEALVEAAEQRFAGGDVPRPPHWGGYRVGLERIEFWQGRRDRTHDRVVYTADGAGGWTIRRLSP
jgi:pyridoxamine 5'-phosphate oxidase